MVNPPVPQELLGVGGSELRATVTGEFIGDAEGHEGALEQVYKTSRTIRGPFHDGPIRVAVNDNQVMFATVLEVVTTYSLERVGREGGWRWRGTWVRGCNPVAIVATFSLFHDGWGDSWPEDSRLRTGEHRGHTLVGRVEDIQYCWTEGGWDDYAVSIQCNTIHNK